MPVILTMAGTVRVALVALLLAGCALTPIGASGPIVTIEAHGGLCPDGECRTVIAIERDGRIHRVEPEPAELSRVTDETIGVIDAATGATDFAAIRARPFTGTCPLAFDGQELIYTFATAHGPERIASCEVEIDPQHPLFVAVHAAVGADVPVPTY